MRENCIRYSAIVLVVIGTLAVFSCNDPQAQAEITPKPKPAASERVAAAVPGEKFPARTFTNLNAAAGGAAQIDLADSLGRQPILLYYWVAGNPRADQVLEQVVDLIDEFDADKIAFRVVAVPKPGLDEKAIRARAQELGLKAPILADTDFRLGQMLQVQTVPSISIVDAEGVLRLTNGASLVQTLEYQLDLAGAIRRVAGGGQLLTYGALERYFPVNELAGKDCPDFRAPLVTNRVEKSWKSLMDPEKVNVLIFWSVDCGHCRRELPEINDWLKLNPEGINVISAATINDEATQLRTREFCQINDFRFPTLIDRGFVIGQQFNITSTPTILFIRPDGVIDSAMTTGHLFGQTAEEKKRLFLGS